MIIVKKHLKAITQIAFVCVGVVKIFIWDSVNMGKSEPTLVAFVFEGILLVAGKPFKSTMHSFVCYTKLDILKYLPEAL